jgi:DNA-binding NarL/FixJ family response regulator
MTDPYTVYLCDDVADIRLLMRFALEESPDLRVVGEAEDGVAGVEGVAETQPDVVLLDLSMPRLDGLEVISRLREVSPSTGIVIFSGFSAERMRELSVRLGADRYLEKGTSIDTVRDVVRAVARERHEAA